MNRRTLNILYLLIYCFAITLINNGNLFAQPSENHLILKSTIDQGGAVSKSTNYLLYDAIGQTSPIGIASSSNYRVFSGLLAGDLNNFKTEKVTSELNSDLPLHFKLYQNYPNPFNPRTTIEYDLPHPAQVFLSIFDLQGHNIRNFTTSTITPGRHGIEWDGRNELGFPISSGLYYYRIKIKPKESGNREFVDIKKMILLK